MLLAIDSLCGVSTPMAWESIDDHLSGKLMLINDCKSVHKKYDGMYFTTQILINGDAAHFLSWMTLGCFESYINMKESQIRSDRLPSFLIPVDVFSIDFFNISSGGMIVVTQTFANDAASIHWWIWCCYIVTLCQHKVNKWAYGFKQRSEVVSWWGNSWTNWHLIMVR